jgi:hypothetical protein
MSRQHNLAIAAFLLFLAICSTAVAEQINPYPRQVTRTDTLREWTFESGEEGWKAAHGCVVSADGGTLKITSTGGDPYLIGPAIEVEPPVTVGLRAKCATAGRGQVFWTTTKSRGWSERKSAHFDLVHDGKWHEYLIRLDAREAVTRLRLDPGTAPGEIEVDAIGLHRAMLHPLEIVQVETGEYDVAADVRNHSDDDLSARIAGQPLTIGGKQTSRVRLGAPGEAPFASVPVVVQSQDLPTIERTVFLHRPQARGDWLTRESDGVTLRVARDGSGARIETGGSLVAVIAPLVHREGVIPKLKLEEKGDTLVFRGEGVVVTLAMDAGEVSVSIDSEVPCEGPVLRALGYLEQGLFAGLEYLGKGERSSSELDIETDERIRFAPDPLKVTMPLMACVTNRGAAAMTWTDMALQPVFATPNFFDGTPDHRMSLRGTKIEATILVRLVPLEETILWAVRKHGLPPLPEPPRDREAQWKLCLASINGPIKGEGGWGHCAERRWTRRPHADMASTIWRLTGEAPTMTEIAGAGSHIRNDTIYFVTSRVDEWLQRKRGEVEGIIRSQKEDGSFRYEGKYQRGHFEDTASGFCAQRAMVLLDYAWITGDLAALDAGTRTLEYMKRFRTPRGAQTWELSLHTPDILASGRLVWAYVRGYELTGNEEYLARARSWALTGVPFVYLWGRYPTMVYATIPVYGATNWRAPNWIGLPVQWCGSVYAYALGLLAPYDQTLDWKRLARGILIAAEQMQYPDGKLVGCLPDIFDLPAQRRAGPSINPCALVSLRMLLDGEVDFLSVAADAGHRVAAPFPVTIREGKAYVRAERGVDYQVLVDGQRIVDIKSQGTDVISLD